MSDNTELQQEQVEQEVIEAAPDATTDEANAQPAESSQSDSELAEIKARLEKAEKIAKDNQAWATRMAQEAAQLRREREQQQREAMRPAILDTNPELADAIRYVANDPTPRHQAEDEHSVWMETIDKAHPGIFSKDIDPELEKDLAARLDQLGDAKSNPLEAIRVITEGKLAHAERQIGKRFAAEAAKMSQKSASSSGRLSRR
jgi:hypothetical protein